jgi:hypothetical protein
MASSEHSRAGTWPCHLPPGVAAVEVIVWSSAPCAGDFCKEDGEALLPLALTTYGRRGNNDSILPTMLVAILKPTPANSCSVPERGTWLDVRHFLHWPCRSAICAGLNPPWPHKTSDGWRSAEGRGVGEAASLVLIQYCRVTAETEGGGILSFGRLEGR